MEIALTSRFFAAQLSGALLVYGICRSGGSLGNIVDFGLNVQAAGDAARYRHYGSSSPTGEDMEGRGLLEVESGVPDHVVQNLRGRGHDVEYDAGGYGGYQAIMWDPEEGVYWGGTEMRKDGYVVGY